MNILITSASRKTWLVKAFQKALSQEASGKVIAVDTSPLSPALYCADEHYLVPASDNAEFLKIMLDLCKQLRIKLLVPTRDEELLFFAVNKIRFEEVGTFVMVSDTATIKMCQDKKLFIDFCRKHRFYTPQCYEIETIQNDSKFPLFIKPCRGKGSKQAFRVDSKQELLAIFSSLAEPIIQEFIQAPEYTIDLFADFSGNVISIVPRQRIYVYGGESFISKTIKHELLINESIRLANALRLTGHNTIQCFLDKGIVKFIEINPRFGGAANLSFAAGVSTPIFMIKLLKGENLKPVIGEFKDNYFMLRYTEDIFLEEEELTRKKFT